MADAYRRRRRSTAAASGGPAATISGVGAWTTRARLANLIEAHVASSGFRLRRDRRIRLRLDERNMIVALRLKILNG
ncbi:hypothetical protein F2Q69_00012727 [Brassica cretica]|uniref:Uncharacterized protein n=1 Tax=Brassica cretica TaxID=69181 RepID=A0A8S9QT67_BRACR|nr:hypothetical protein F2Q69_00012727 [Brassica cretica]